MNFFLSRKVVTASCSGTRRVINPSKKNTLVPIKRYHSGWIFASYGLVVVVGVSGGGGKGLKVNKKPTHRK